MRLWSLHPRYLDARGLVALWREALLAQAVLRGEVLRGETKGYRKHPQLRRFRDRDCPVAYIARYLRGVHAESVSRGYRFDAGRIAHVDTTGHIDVPRGQIVFEWRHLKAKLAARAPDQCDRLAGTPDPEPHPLMRVVPGGVADWERP